jgi:hypothetical protein
MFNLIFEARRICKALQGSWGDDGFEGDEEMQQSIKNR